MRDEVFDVWCSIVAYKTPEDEIHRVISALARVNARMALTIIDNSSSLLLDTARYGFPVEIIPSKNIGYGRAHNVAISESRFRCRYHLVMNSDIVFDSGVIDALIQFMDSRPSAGLVMPMVKYPDGRIQHLCRLLPDPAVLIGRRFFGRSRWARKLNYRYELHGWSYDKIANFPFLSGCFMFIRREILDKVEGFDPRYFLYAEDLDLSRRIHEISETIFYPQVCIVHEYRSLKRRSYRQWLYAILSLIKYFNKWGWLRDRERDAINARTLERLFRSS
ncbi:MAG: glycosyltransferase [Sphingomonas sp.]|nr:glycosyltransferase [Sphingomonas sp.]